MPLKNTEWSNAFIADSDPLASFWHLHSGRIRVTGRLRGEVRAIPYQPGLLLKSLSNTAAMCAPNPMSNNVNSWKQPKGIEDISHYSAKWSLGYMS